MLSGQVSKVKRELPEGFAVQVLRAMFGRLFALWVVEGQICGLCWLSVKSWGSGRNGWKSLDEVVGTAPPLLFYLTPTPDGSYPASRTVSLANPRPPSLTGFLPGHFHPYSPRPARKRPLGSLYLYLFRGRLKPPLGRNDD